MAGEPGNRECPFLRERLRNDPRLRAEVETARAWSVPRSVFLGRVVNDGEPLWTDKDREWALALEAEEKATHSCGQLSEESFNPESDGMYTAEAVRCHACAASAREAASFADDEHADTAGLVFVTTRREP